jgi:hypothetical protein
MKIKINIPTSWNDLSKTQFEAVILVLSQMTASISRDKKIFKILVEAKWWQLILKARTRYVLSQVPMSELRKNFLFIFKENNRTHFEPKIKVGSKVYYGPMDRIINLTAEEFSVADDLHIRYRKTKEVDYLRYLFHVLYTEELERPVFDKLKLERKINPKIPLKTLLATEIVYFGCKNHIANKYQKIFPKSEGDASGKSTGFFKVIQGMTKGDLSKLQIVEQINIYKFLDQFQDDIEAIQKQNLKK